MHPVFGEFLDDCRSTKPTPEVFQFTLAVADAMSRYFPDEAERVEAFSRALKAHAQIHLHATAVQRNTTDLALRKGAYIILSVKGKKEAWPSSGDPSIQNATYYGKHIATDPKMSQSCRMPIFLLNLEGLPLSIGLRPRFSC